MANVRAGKRWRSRRKRRERAREPCAWRSRSRCARECAPSSLAAVRVRCAPLSVRRTPFDESRRVLMIEVVRSERVDRSDDETRSFPRRTSRKTILVLLCLICTLQNGYEYSNRTQTVVAKLSRRSLADHASQRPLLHHGRALVTGREALVQRERRRERALLFARVVVVPRAAARATA